MQPVRFLSALATVVALAACDTTGSEPDLTGTWDATSVVATNPANGDAVDLIQDQGISMELTIDADDSVEIRFTLGDTEDIEPGTIRLDGDQVTLTIEGDPSTGTWLLEGDILTLDLVTGVVWDVDRDGLEEPVTMVVVLRRRT